MPRAGFNQHKPIPGLLCFGLHISSRNKSAESPEPRRAGQGLPGAGVARTGWECLWKAALLSEHRAAPSARGAEPGHPSAARLSAWCHLRDAAPATPHQQDDLALPQPCVPPQPINQIYKQYRQIHLGTKAFLPPWAGNSFNRPPRSKTTWRHGQAEGEPGGSSCTAQHVPGISLAVIM